MTASIYFGVICVYVSTSRTRTQRPFLLLAFPCQLRGFPFFPRKISPTKPVPKEETTEVADNMAVVPIMSPSTSMKPAHSMPGRPWEIVTRVSICGLMEAQRKISANNEVNSKAGGVGGNASAHTHKSHTYPCDGQMTGPTKVLPKLTKRSSKGWAYKADTPIGVLNSWCCL